MEEQITAVYSSQRILKRNVLDHKGFDLQTEVGINVFHSGLLSVTDLRWITWNSRCETSNVSQWPNPFRQRLGFRLTLALCVLSVSVSVPVDDITECNLPLWACSAVIHRMSGKRQNIRYRKWSQAALILWKWDFTWIRNKRSDIFRALKRVFMRIFPAELHGSLLKNTSVSLSNVLVSLQRWILCTEHRFRWAAGKGA